MNDDGIYGNGYHVHAFKLFLDFLVAALLVAAVVFQFSFSVLYRIGFVCVHWYQKYVIGFTKKTRVVNVRVKTSLPIDNQLVIFDMTPDLKVDLSLTPIFE